MLHVRCCNAIAKQLGDPLDKYMWIGNPEYMGLTCLFHRIRFCTDLMLSLKDRLRGE